MLFISLLLINKQSVNQDYKSKKHMFSRKFGADIENLVKEKSNNHIVLKSRSFSFDGKSKAPSHITRKVSAAEQRPALAINRTMAQPALISDKSPSLLSNIQNDEQLVPAFLKDCIKHMRSKEPNKKQLIEQIKINNPWFSIRRSEIIDWMVSMHFQLKLFTQTLYMAVSHMDQFCSKVAVKETEIHLMAASCLFISGKFQQTYRIPTVRSIQQVSNKTLEKSQIIRMESRIMEELNFSLIVDSPSKYLELFTRMVSMSDKNYHIAQYILELSLLDLTFSEYSSSMLGSAVVYLVNKIRKISPGWPSDFQELSGYSQNDLKACAKNLCSLLERSQQLENGRSVRAKFARPQFFGASNIRLQRKNQ